MTKNRNWLAGLAAFGFATTSIVAGSAQAQTQPQQGQKQQQGQMQQDRMQQDRTQQGQTQQGQEQQLTGKIAKAEKSQLYLETQSGAVVPFKLGSKVQWEGQTQQGEPLRSAQQLQEGDEVQVSFTSEKNANAAKMVKLEKPQEQQELTGKVKSASGQWIHVEHEGAIVPLKVSKQTKFQGQTAKGEQVKGASQIKQGDEVRASFNVTNETDNEAQSIELQSSGQQEQQPGQQQQQGQMR